MIVDISELSITLSSTKSGEVPLTTTLSDDGLTVNCTISDSYDLTTPGNYTLAISGIDKIRFRRLADDQIVTTVDLSPNCTSSRTYSYTVSHIDSRNFTLSYPDPAKAPGECCNIGGNYSVVIIDPGVSKDQDFRSYDQDAYAAANVGWVEDENGNKICEAQYSHYYNTFSLTPDKLITAPGVYYLVYPAEGTMNYYNSLGTLSGKQHITHFKVGPYEVKDSPDAVKVKALARVPGQSYYTDALPDYLVGTYLNASVLQFKTPDASHLTTLSILYTDTDGVTSGEYAEYSTDYHFEGNTVKAVFPDEAYKGAGTYNVRWNLGTADNIEGVSPYNQSLDFSKIGTYSFVLTLRDPSPSVDDVSIYRHATADEEFQLDPGQTIAVRLSHKLASSDVKIYYRWTPAHSESGIVNTIYTSADADGYTLHSDDIAISSPGTLEYYMVHSNTRSDIKSISFVAREIAAIGEVDTDNELKSKFSSAVPGIYNLSGVRVAADATDLPIGFYIKVASDHTVSKILIR
ncbi:MAG: hypothetical protein K2K79_02160 [Paramuribaculum sp.]|nr:hypothetical protein [Paramuribaculum sp.]